ncbi:DUF2304 domain-containing protein [Maridesulfovibrio zosterae]|uniref:DUF2304 domain-containing protein n=1 Tax=Maridesulfovibrio zosterae TaxID=82171 RepID=UPI0003F59A8B|nr:DUF2304 domain-containing protein [Maridesulfovibrio zosterae]
MAMTLFKYIPSALSVFFVLTIFFLIRKQRFGIFQTVWWLFSAFSILVLGLFPSFADKLGSIIGIHYPPILPIILAICMLFVKILTMDIERTRQEIKIRILIQKLGTQEAELQDLKDALAEKKR